MPVTIRPRATLPTDADLDAFEEEFGHPLPSAYCAFLRSCDGGNLVPPRDADGSDCGAAFHAEPIPPLTRDEAMIAPGNLWDIAFFHGLLREPREYGLRQALRMMRDFGHPAELLPVAGMTGGGAYFLCAAGPLRGEVLVAVSTFMREPDDERPVTQADYHRVAPNFGILLDGLEWIEPARWDRLVTAAGNR